MNRMNELINELNRASELYYNGKESFLTDTEFDKKLNELKCLEQETKIIYANSPTINVGAPVLSELKKIKIGGKPMLSLDKVHSAQEIIDFDSSDDLIASIKCDGLSVRLVYQDTDLVSANTRGNGYEGQDITEHAKHFLNVPVKIAKTGTYIIDGEAVILESDLAIVNSTRTGDDIFKVARNAASGAFTLQDMREFTNRRVSFIAWDVIEGGSTWYYHYNMEEANSLGFTIVPSLALDCTKIESEEIENINQTLFKEAEEKGIPCDGVVWRINDNVVGDEKGSTAHHFLNAVAFKSSDKEYETRLKYIDYDISRNGVLTPVAVFDPVEIDGTIVERASLHNLSIMEELLGEHPEKGQKIWVVKKNMIIPQIVRAEKNDIYHVDRSLDFKGIAAHCPICGKHPAIITSENGVRTLVCENPECEGKLANRIDHYVGKKGLDIKGLSIKTIEKLIEWGWINGFRDIYKLNEHRTEWMAKAGFGKASVEKIINSIERSKTSVELWRFISALGIPLVGNSVSKEITKYYFTWEEFRSAVGGDWTEFDGFGSEISKAINSFDYTEADEIVKLFTFAETKAKESDKFAGITFCVTGKLKMFKKRDDLKADIESKGGKMTSTVSSKTNYLVTNTPDSGTEKNKQAQKLGIPIITEEDYLNL